MNYDFKENWDDVILPLLSHPSIKKSIKKELIVFLKNLISKASIIRINVLRNILLTIRGSIILMIMKKN
jgi:hypothetical protein